MKLNLSFTCKPEHCTASVSRMKYQTLLNISELEMTMVSLWWRIVSSSLAWHTSSVDCHVSVTFQPFFLVSFVACLLHAPCQVQVTVSVWG